MTDVRLSEHFALSEFTVSQTAGRLGLDNTPSPDIVDRLRGTAAHLEPVRALLGCPLLISSGYRSAAVNKEIHGAVGSAHVLGYAADFIAPGFGSPLAICRAIVAAGVRFDQMIEEGTWVHLSFDPRMRGEVLTKADGGYHQGLR